MADVDKGWRVFESYTRRLIAYGENQYFEYRSYYGGVERRGNDNSTIPVGQCSEIRLVVDVVENCIKHRNVMFHSVNSNNPLIDYMYQDSEGHFHAFLVTTGMRHDATIQKIKELEEMVATKHVGTR